MGVIFVAPDTSPRGDDVPDDPDGLWDFGLGAGFYVDATEAPWDEHFNMWTYLADELPASSASISRPTWTRQAISGHSMGGHGALTLALGIRGGFESVSAFSPIVAPRQVPWGRKALSTISGADRARGGGMMRARLIEDGARVTELLVDIGRRRPVPRQAIEAPNCSRRRARMPASR